MTVTIQATNNTEFQQLLIELQQEFTAHPASTQFIEYCAARIGYSVLETSSIFADQVLPFIALSQADLPTAISSPAVGTLVDLAAEHGPGAIQDIASQCLEHPCETAAEYIQRYSETRARLLAQHVAITTEIWPEVASIELADTKGYKGCSSGSNSYSSSSSSYSSSSSSSSSNSSSSRSSSSDSEGSPVGIVILAVGYCFYNFPIITSIALAVFLANVFFARWIWRWLNFTLYAVPAGYGASLLAVHLPPDPSYLRIGVIAMASLFAGGVGYSIAQLRQQSRNSAQRVQDEE